MDAVQIVIAVLGVAAAAPYVQQILNRQASPKFASWASVALVGIGLAVCSYLRDGVTGAFVFAVASSTANVIISVLIFWQFGIGHVGLREKVFTGLTFLCGAVWVYQGPAWATWCAIGILCGSLYMLALGVWKNPHSEVFSAWCMNFVAVWLTWLTRQEGDSLELTKYFVSSTTLMVALMAYRRRFPPSPPPL